MRTSAAFFGRRRCAGDLVGRVAAQRDEVRHLLGLDAVALAHLGRPDARELAHTLDRLKDRHAVGDELERVAVRRRDEHRAGPRARRRGEEVVGLVAARLRDREAERLDECGQHPELLEDRLLELAARLVLGQRLVAVGRRLERVPGDEHRLGLLRLPEPHQEVREADERVQADRLRQRVVGAVGQRVAVDRQEHAAHSDASSSWIAAIRRSVVSTASCGDRRSGRRSARARPRAGAGRRALDPGRDERHARLDRDARGAGVRLRGVLLADALPAACALREHRDHVALARELDGGLDRLAVGAAAVHLERAARAR